MEKNRSGLTSATLLTISFMAFACQETGRPSVGAAPVERIKALTREMDTQVARAVEVSPSHIHVDISSRAGDSLFSVDIQPGGSGEETVVWNVPPEAATGPAAEVTRGALPVPLEQLPTLEVGIKLAVFVQSRVIGSMNGQDYDNWGCDLPYHNVASCRVVPGSGGRA